MYQEAARSYQQTNVLTANPLKLVLMCYDGAIRSLKLARAHYEAKEYEAKSRALQKALDIIHELATALDLKRGGDVAKNLLALYAYMTQALTEADLKREPAVFSKVAEMLEELESSWKTLAAGPAETSHHPIPAGVPKAPAATAAANRAWSV